MELIDKKPLIRHLVDWQMEQFAEVGHERELNLLDLIIKGIENEPTVEAQEVVRCKDCKYFCVGYPNALNADGLCENTDVLMDSEDFCSCGESMRTSAE